MNAHKYSKLNRLIVPVAALTAFTAILGAAILIQYQYAVHYFTVNYWWYQLRTHFLFWDNLHFAFLHGTSESTSVLALVFGASGLAFWKLLSLESFPRGVGFGIISMFGLCYAASLLTHQATFPELLALSTVQMGTVAMFCACVRRRHLLRFSMLDLMILSLSVALLLLPGLIDHVGSIILLDRSLHSGTANIFLLLIGLMAGLTTVAFLSVPDISLIYRVPVLCGAGILGYGLAWLFETLPEMQWGRGNLGAVNFSRTHFRYGYTVLFPLSGIIATALVPAASHLSIILKVASISCIKIAGHRCRFKPTYLEREKG